MKDKIIYTIKVAKDKTIPCNLQVKYVRFIDEDDNGIQYRKTLKYMENTFTANKNLVKLLIDAPKNVRTIIDYITTNLSYNQTVIELRNNIISNSTKLHVSEVTRGIKYLKEHDVIRKMREIEGYENDNMFSEYMYFVNPEYIYHGSLNSLIKNDK